MNNTKSKKMSGMARKMLNSIYRFSSVYSSLIPVKYLFPENIIFMRHMHLASLVYPKQTKCVHIYEARVKMLCHYQNLQGIS